MSGNTETDFLLGATFDFDGNNPSHSGGKCEEGNLVSRHIMASIPAISPQTTDRQDTDPDAKSLAPALAFDLYSAIGIRY